MGFRHQGLPPRMENQMENMENAMETGVSATRTSPLLLSTQP